MTFEEMLRQQEELRRTRPLREAREKVAALERLVEGREAYAGRTLLASIRLAVKRDQLRLARAELAELEARR